MNRIHRFGDCTEIDEKNRVKMYKKGSQWVTANQTSFMLLGKHALAKGLAIALGTVALGLGNGQAASADSVDSTTESNSQPTASEQTTSSSNNAQSVKLKTSENTSGGGNDQQYRVTNSCRLNGKQSRVFNQQ